ncbi:MAG: methionyl-tRNA formyltransferase [Deltaproteobacteria bacterium]|nr:methionyl-tRNA formyltransferase [Deltaproteobacteria bacterium]
MRIALFGQAAFAEKVLDGLIERGHDVVATYCPPDAGTRPDPFKARALALGLSVHQHKSLKGPEVPRELAAYAPELGVLAYVTQIVPPAVFETPRLGSICFHPSLLPRYRGGSAIPWQIIKGETRTGVSLFWVDPGIDTGPLLLQRDAAIGPDDTAGSLYYNTLFPLGVDAVLDAVDLVADGDPPRETQNEALATYDPLCRDEHAALDWRRPVAEVYNLIRGCDPQPGAWFTHGDAKVRCHDARRVDRADATPAQVLSVDADGVTIGAAGGAIRVGRLRVGDKKLAAAEAAEGLGLRPGTTL